MEDERKIKITVSAINSPLPGLKQTYLIFLVCLLLSDMKMLPFHGAGVKNQMTKN